MQLDESQSIITLAKIGCNSSHQLQNLAAHVLVDQSKGEKGSKGHQGRKGPKGGNRCQRAKRAKRWYFLAKGISCPPRAKGEGRAWDNSGKGPGKPMVFQVSDVQLQVLNCLDSERLPSCEWKIKASDVHRRSWRSSRWKQPRWKQPALFYLNNDWGATSGWITWPVNWRIKAV